MLEWNGEKILLQKKIVKLHQGLNKEGVDIFMGHNGTWADPLWYAEG